MEITAYVARGFVFCYLICTRLADLVWMASVKMELESKLGNFVN